jgi:hypothetical protein
MLRRLLLGLVEGLAIGLALGVACARGFGLGAVSSVVALLLGAIAGFAIGLVAGRPIWARDAKTEALLKGAAGALGGILLSVALRRWLSVAVDLSAFSLGAGPAGQLPVLALPAITTALALFFELDDDGSRTAKMPLAARSKKRRIEPEPSSEASPDDSELLDDEVDRKFEKR